MRTALPAIVTIALICAAGTPSPCHAVDNFETDDTAGSAASINLAGHPPQLRDLQSAGGVADEDWMQVWMRSYRSYEVRISNARSTVTIADLERWNNGGDVLLQNAGTVTQENTSSGGRQFLRWQTDDLTLTAFGQVNKVRVVGGTSATAANSQYLFEFRETTLYCPRFNNAGTQASVLIVQWSGDGANSCSVSAHFFEQTTRSLLATLTSTPNSGIGPLPAAMQVYALATTPGLEGQRGSAHIAHTCGYGNLKAKLVALEPATGFSFDTQCTMREQ